MKPLKITKVYGKIIGYHINGMTFASEVVAAAKIDDPKYYHKVSRAFKKYNEHARILMGYGIDLVLYVNQETGKEY